MITATEFLVEEMKAGLRAFEKAHELLLKCPSGALAEASTQITRVRYGPKIQKRTAAYSDGQWAHYVTVETTVIDPSDPADVDSLFAVDEFRVD